jgi:EmrB/QacA subfamily drug resistance transporter
MTAVAETTTERGTSPPEAAGTDRRRWATLAVLCLVQLMLALDDTVVNVALPTIQSDLGFSQSGLSWVVNVYLLAFGGFLLLGGRGADVFGRRRVFLIGLSIFAVASLASGIAQEPAVLVASRAAQGFGAALASSSGLALITLLFRTPAERAKAIGLWTGMTGLAGTTGVVIGGALTSYASWRWCFLVNPPLAVIAAVAVLRLVRESRTQRSGRLDVAGPLAITGALLLLIHALLRAPGAGWTASSTLALLAGAVMLFVAFLIIESRHHDPLVPLKFFADRTRASANGLNLLMFSALLATFFCMSLYMQHVLGYSPIKTGLAYLPFGLSLGVALGISSALIPRVGVKPVVVPGLIIGAIGMVLFSRVPEQGSYVTDLLPGMLVLPLGLGAAGFGLSIAALSGADRDEAGLAAGVVNSMEQIGGSLGLAVLVSLAVDRTSNLIAEGTPARAAQASGFELAFLTGAALLTAGAILAVMLLGPVREEPEPAAAQAAPAG